MVQRFYQDMTAEEQTLWVNDYATVIEEHCERIELLGKGKEQLKAEDLPWVKNLFGLLAAWPFAADFCEKALRYGDFSARAGRLSVYVNKTKDALAEGLVTTDANGKKVAFVSPSTPLRRRGRPTREEVAARLRGESLVLPGNSPENEKRRRIAKMLGLEVVVSGDAPREKNNAELAAERAAKKAEFERQNPSLFGDNGQQTTDNGQPQTIKQQSAQQATVPVGSVGWNPNGQTATPTTPQSLSMGEIYQDRIENDRLHLSDIKWLCTKELQDRIDKVRAQRTAFGDAAQTAKVLADRGAAQEEIALYAKQAEEAREAFESTYAAVDDELAVLHKRLTIDVPYTEKFKTRFKGVDLEKVLHITRPYYEKLRKENPAIDARIKRLIEQDSPEYAAHMKAEEEKKQEVADLLRYITRKDKGPSDERCKTLAVRIERLRELKGDEFADAYLPILEKTKEENAKMRAEKEAKKEAKQESKKPRKAQNNKPAKK